MGKVKGIRKRWMLNSISAVLLIVLFAVAAFSAAIASYFYSTMSTGLKSRVTAALPFFSSAMTRSPVSGAVPVQEVSTRCSMAPEMSGVPG